MGYVILLINFSEKKNFVFKMLQDTQSIGYYSFLEKLKKTPEIISINLRKPIQVQTLGM